MFCFIQVCHSYCFWIINGRTEASECNVSQLRILHASHKPKSGCKYSSAVYVSAHTQWAHSTLWDTMQVKCNHYCSLFSSIILSFLLEMFCHVSPLLLWCFESQWIYLIYEVTLGNLYSLIMFFFSSFPLLFDHVLISAVIWYCVFVVFSGGRWPSRPSRSCKYNIRMKAHIDHPSHPPSGVFPYSK